MLHTPTLLLVNTLLFMTLALCLGWVSRSDRSDGLFHWGAALWLHSGAYLLFILRGTVSDWASIVLANTLLSATFALMLEGLRHFLQVPARRVLDWGPVGVTVLVFALLLDDIHTRVVFGSALLAVQLGQVIGLLLRRWVVTLGRGKYFVLGAFTVFGLMLLGRLLATLLGQIEMTSVRDSSVFQTVTFLFASVTMVLASFGMVVMTRDQADARNITLALHDELTGLYNRRYIQQALEQQIAVARRSRSPMAVLMLDIDHFKRVNDSFGHLSGDKVLRDLAACITKRLRAQDIAGRWGGEEFVVLLPDTAAAGGRVLAETLREAVEQQPFTALDGQPIPLTISIGLHAMPGSAKEATADIVGTADRALYLAKEKGRNRVEEL